MPTARLGREAGAGTHIPFHAHAVLRQVHHLHVDAWFDRAEVGGSGKVLHTVLALHRVIGLAAVHPVAIHADAHA